MNAPEKYFDKFNIMIIGDEKVGKSTILERYFNKKYSSDRRQTLGVECFEKDKYIDNKKILFKVWDTAGQEKFAVITKNYYQRAHGIILTCALNNKQSFKNFKNWLLSIRDNTTSDLIQLIIIANKSDLVNEREVDREEIENLARDIKVEYFETSAKENTNIDEAFNTIIDKVYRSVYKKEGIKDENMSRTNINKFYGNTDGNGNNKTDQTFELNNSKIKNCKSTTKCGC